MSATTNEISPAINAFFLNIYGRGVEANFEKNATYSVAEKNISITIDRYRGCHVNFKEVKAFKTEFQMKVKDAIDTLSKSFEQTQECNSIWINIPLPCAMETLGAFAPKDFHIGMKGKCGFIIDEQANLARLWKWLNPEDECTIPTGCTHSNGGSAVLIDKIAKKVLLVVNVDRNKSWNLPGGGYEKEDKEPRFTAWREALEEGGIDDLSDPATLNSLRVGEMCFPYNPLSPAINQIWAYSVDGISQKKLNPPKKEIQHAEWVDFDRVLGSDGKLDNFVLGDEIKIFLNAAIYQRGFKQLINKKWMIVYGTE